MQSALLGLPIQMLIESRNTLTETPRIMFDQMSEYPWPVKLIHKFKYLTVCYTEQKFLILIRLNLFIIPFIVSAFGVNSKNLCLSLEPKDFLLCFFLNILLFFVLH